MKRKYRAFRLRQLIKSLTYLYYLYYRYNGTFRMSSVFELKVIREIKIKDIFRLIPDQIII